MFVLKNKNSHYNITVKTHWNPLYLFWLLCFRTSTYKCTETRTPRPEPLYRETDLDCAQQTISTTVSSYLILHIQHQLKYYSFIQICTLCGLFGGVWFTTRWEEKPSSVFGRHDISDTTLKFSETSWTHEKYKMKVLRSTIYLYELFINKVIVLKVSFKFLY